MKFVPKTNPCALFDDYIAIKKPQNWKKVEAGPKLVLHQHLLEEQQHLCVYCQQSIPKKRQKDQPPTFLHPSHVEHIRPKSIFRHLVFDHKNLAVSCDGFEIDAAARAHPDFCGHKKDDFFDDALFVHPSFPHRPFSPVSPNGLGPQNPTFIENICFKKSAPIHLWPILKQIFAPK